MRQLKIIKQVTNRETASLDKYLQEIGREEMISADEEVQLAIKIRQGDRAALERFNQSKFKICSFCFKTISKPRSRFTRFN